MNETSASTEEGLRKELTDISLFPVTTVNTYLAALPSNEANDLLAQIAQDADREHPTFWSYLFVIFWLLLSFDGFIDLPTGRKTKRRMAGVRAALYLAQRGDLRAIVPLARTWDSRPLSRSEYQAQIEQNLIQLLSRMPTDGSVALPSAPLAELAERVWHSRRRWRDLEAGRADLLTALIRQLGSRPGEAQNTLRLLQEGGSGANRARVREIARLASA